MLQLLSAEDRPWQRRSDDCCRESVTLTSRTEEMPTWTPPGALGVLQLDDLLEEEEAEIRLWVAARFYYTVGRLFCVTLLVVGSRSEV